MTDLKGCVVLVTGASRGTGQATAVAFAAEGCHVALVARNEKGLAETAELCRKARKDCRTLVLVTDITKKDQVANAVLRCVQELGGLNILVSSSTGFTSDPEFMFQEHAMAQFRLSELAIPHIRREAATKPSCLLYIASLGSKITFRGGGPYCAAKHAVLGYAGCMYEELREEGIKVCSILPGYVNEVSYPSQPNLDTEKMIQPSDIAESCLFVAKFPTTACPTEIVIRPQRGCYKNCPNSVMPPGSAVPVGSTARSGAASTTSSNGTSASSGTSPEPVCSKRRLSDVELS